MCRNTNRASGGPIFNRTIDSTTSGSDGHYSMTFKTTGQGIEYRLAFIPGPKYYSFQNTENINIGKDNTIDFWAYKLHVLKARIIVTQNPNPPLFIYTAISSFPNEIDAASQDTTIYLKALPNIENYIYFVIGNIDTPSIYNARIDTIIFPLFTDTFTHTFQVDPRLFQKRL